ncbi:MAG: hypothetical protein RSG07_04800 [Erysipelotrichaceae bacterium]
MNKDKKEIYKKIWKPIALGLVILLIIYSNSTSNEEWEECNEKTFDEVRDYGMKESYKAPTGREEPEYDTNEEFLLEHFEYAKSKIDMNGLRIDCKNDKFQIYGIEEVNKGKYIIEEEKLIYESEHVMQIHYVGSEFMLLEDYDSFKEFSIKDRKLTGVEYEGIKSVSINGGPDFDGFFKGDILTLYNENGSKSVPITFDGNKIGYRLYLIQNADGSYVVNQ